MLNRKGCELLGVTPEQAVGTDWFETFLPEDVRKETRGVFETLMVGNQDTHRYHENPVLTSSGEERIVAWHASLLYDDTGNVIGTLSSGTDVTARASAEQKLRESERHIREITDALPVVVYEADETGRVTFANATAFDMFGYTKEELEGGMSIFQLAAPADRKRARAMFRRRGGGDNVGQVGYTGLRKDGSTFPFSNLGAPIRRGGAIVGIRGIAIDITELERAEEKVREHTRTIEILNRIATEGNRATDVQSFAETATKLACELMHFDIGGVYLIDMDARYATLWYAQGLPKTGQGAVEKIPCQDPPFNAILIDGEPLFAEDYVTFLPQHAPLGIASLASVPLYSQDVIIGVLNVGSATPHTFSRVEKDLLIAIGNEGGTVIAKLQTEESLKKHAQMVDLAKDGIIIRDLDDRIVYWNKGAERLYGWSAAEAEGQKIYTLLHTKRPQPREEIRSMLFAKGGLVGEFRHTTKDGRTIAVDSRQTLYKDAAGKPAAIFEINTDITKRKLLEEELAWESAINSTIARLFTPLIAPTSTIEDIALAILDEAKLLTGSEHGFVSLIDPVNRDMISFGLTQMMLSECAIPEEKRQIRFPIGTDGSYPALWGHALNTKKGFYTNAPATHPVARGTPDGHTPLAQFLAAPVLIRDNTEGEIALANPGRDYTERDLNAVERLADVYALAVVRTREEDEIKASLKERETLLKEIHHRVKNNMQIISSLLSLQAAQATQPETVEMLDESQRRIRSMALIHEKLYRSGSLAEIDFGDYVESLGAELLRIYNVPLGTITITVDIENVQLGVDTAIPCALIINELVSNSLKYAFPDGRTGDVTVALQRANGAHTLTVADDGVRFPADLDFRATDSLGMQLVVMLVNQLEGTIELNRENGTAFVISFHVD
jgi:PAS domain S-box-containing protein